MVMGQKIISKYELILFYQTQLRKFYTLGIGKKTENRVVITQTLIDATQRRLTQLRGVVGEIEIA